MTKADIEVVKTSVTLPRETYDKLKAMSARSGSSMRDVIRRAIQTEELLHETKVRGGKVLIKQKDNSIRQVVFKGRRRG